MKEIIKYTDVIRFGKSCTEGVLQEGDYISITQKLDGANASFVLDETNEVGVSSYWHNKPVTKENNLRGYYEWIIKNVIPIKQELNPRYRYYGEYLVSHKVIYKPKAYQQFYLFSIWDEVSQLYLSDEIVKSEAERLHIKTVPYFYEGKYISFEHLMSFVGKSDLTLTPDTGEGIVVKNIKYINKYGRQLFVKLVSEKFAEVQKQKLPKNPNVANGLTEIVKSVLTKARLSKLILKLVDEGLVQENYAIEDMGTILRTLGSRTYDDIMKEESDLFVDYEVDQVKKIVGRSTPNIVKQILKDEGRM